MDDLISRETAIRQTMGKLDYVDTIFDKPTESEIVYMLRSLPSVPAVPLDKLCEWLAKNASWYATEIDGDPEEWKSILTEWMEEQNEQKETIP